MELRPVTRLARPGGEPPLELIHPLPLQLSGLTGGPLGGPLGVTTLALGKPRPIHGPLMSVVTLINIMAHKFYLIFPIRIDVHRDFPAYRGNSPLIDLHHRRSRRRQHLAVLIVIGDPTTGRGATAGQYNNQHRQNQSKNLHRKVLPFKAQLGHISTFCTHYIITINYLSIAAGNVYTHMAVSPKLGLSKDSP